MILVAIVSLPLYVKERVPLRHLKFFLLRQVRERKTIHGLNGAVSLKSITAMKKSKQSLAKILGSTTCSARYFNFELFFLIQLVNVI